jgi:hypothetical protein
MIHKNKRANHSPQPERQNAFDFHRFADSCVSGLNYDIQHGQGFINDWDNKGKVSLLEDYFAAI